MGDNPDFSGVLVMLCLPLVVWVLNHSWARRLLRPVGSWFWTRLTAAEQPDAATLELWHALRRQRLQRDLERVRRLVADDAWMSATRQVGNRIAYEQLLAELSELGPAPALAPAVSWGPAPEPALAPASSAAPPVFAGPPSGSSTPTVEILELGPARRGGRRPR